MDMLWFKQIENLSVVYCCHIKVLCGLFRFKSAEAAAGPRGGSDGEPAAAQHVICARDNDSQEEAFDPCRGCCSF